MLFLEHNDLSLKNTILLNKYKIIIDKRLVYEYN
ncbi:Uncharacterised protein [Catenibacterium mitsuokai]|nr:Uncharacterised protein [Catenibacterium mitsuokai]